MMRYYLVTMKDPQNPPKTGPEGRPLPAEQKNKKNFAFAYIGETAPNIDMENWTMKEYDSMDNLKKASMLAYQY